MRKGISVVDAGCSRRWTGIGEQPGRGSRSARRRPGTPRHPASAKCKPRKHAKLCGPLKQPRGPPLRRRPLRRPSSTTSRTMATRFPSPNMRLHTRCEAEIRERQPQNSVAAAQNGGAEGGIGGWLGSRICPCVRQTRRLVLRIELCVGRASRRQRTRTMTGRSMRMSKLLSRCRRTSSSFRADCRNASDASTDYGSVVESLGSATAQHLRGGSEFRFD